MNRIPFLPVSEFLRDVVDGEHCFICCAAPGSVTFNKEHVIPDWIVRRYGLERETIELAGGTIVGYTKYKVPCCKACNDSMERNFETPLSRVIGNGIGAVREHMRTSDGRQQIYSWLSLIFLKTHLKDREYRIDPDRRVESGQISELTDWGEMYHLHCLARAFYTGAKIGPQAYGTLLVMKAETGSMFGDFDYMDYAPGMAMMLRLSDVVFFAVFNDGGFVASVLGHRIAQQPEPLRPVQCRELAVLMAYMNTLLDRRPEFVTHVSADSGEATIDGRFGGFPSPPVFVPQDFGRLFYEKLGTMLPRIPFPNREEVEARIRAGEWSFLLTSDPS
ncbi:MAG TPA: hypothetical protein VGL53_01995 [Bryobacteraceae bacterium]|jgi:hypothetical protein